MHFSGGKASVSIFKTLFAFIMVAAIAAIGAGWPSHGLDSATMVNAAPAHSPTPTVSVTTLPAMPGTPTKPPATAPATLPTTTPVPLSIPAPTPTPLPVSVPTAPAVGVAFIPVQGEVSNALALTLSDLQHMKSLSLTLRFHTYTGVPLSEILKKAQLTFPDDPQTLMRKYVYIQGFNGQTAILSFPEFSKQFAGQLVLLAYLVDLKDVKQPGFAQLVVQGDKTDARFIKVARLIIGEAPTPH
jgi:DMSO/TMAO reductase YedYZ molybdopterin-dependent catalytic subunit